MRDVAAGTFVAAEIAAWMTFFVWLLDGGNWLALGLHAGILIHAVGPLS